MESSHLQWLHERKDILKNYCIQVVGNGTKAKDYFKE